MPLEELLNDLRANPRFLRNVTAWRTLPTQEAADRPWPPALDPALISAAQRLGITAPYSHQAQAIDAVLQGKNAVMATGTASGKTLGYVLPLLNGLLHDPEATALLLFPTKALAHDQMAALGQWIDRLGGTIALSSYDGDTAKSHRTAIRSEARILVSNPDMLHLGILPHHTQWMRFFSGLRYVVLDEIHTYRGVFGSHIANLLRRLRRTARFYGTDPQFIAASATIANPQALAEALWEDPVTLVDTDGAPYGQRHVIFYNPPLLNPELGLRASAAGEATTLAIRLLQAGVQAILFARSRLTVELLLREVRSHAIRAGFAPDAVQGYRGGYLPQERRAIEKGLREGKTRVVIATNALELGIDIGALDASVLVGYPGSIAATRQQMGRAGRRAGTSLSILIATPSPLDQYLVTHPEYFFGRSPEEARVNPNALGLLAAHLACAAFELPFESGEPFGRCENVEALLQGLSEEGLLHAGGEQFTWVGETYPAQSVSLRTTTADTVIIQAAGPTEEIDALQPTGVIGVVDRPSAARTVYQGAIYFHGGTSYLVTALNWEQGVAQVAPVDATYYTVATEAVEVERLALRRTVTHPDLLPPGDAAGSAVTLTDEEVLVHSRPVAYRQVDLTSRETLGWGEIDLPEQVLETEACRLSIGPALVEALAQEGVHLTPLDYGPDWPQIRAAALERDHHACRLCHAVGTAERPLEVHHITPLRTFLAQYPPAAALHLAHAQENLLTLCPECHHKVEQSRGARTALSGLTYLLHTLAPIFLMCDPGDLGTSVQARDPESKQPSAIFYDAAPGGVGLAPRLVDLWLTLVQAARERVDTCPCTSGCPSCVGPVGENEASAKKATSHLLALI